MSKVTARLAGLVLLIVALVPTSLAAQSDPRLAAAVREAQEGRSDSARISVQQLLAKTPASDTLYPQILYTAGIIANEAADMRRQLQRVAVEFPTSSWADDALLRLAQLDYATRQLDGAAGNLERIAIDFPATSLLPQAAYWAGRTYFDLKKDADACRWLADGIARSRDDIEIQTQLSYLYQRCGTAPTARADSTAQPSQVARPDSTTQLNSTALPDSAARPNPVASQASSAASSSPSGPRFRVQIAAVATSAAADAAAYKAQALGYRTAIVQEGGLYKVRTGDFPTRAEAAQAAATLKAKLGGSPFVVSN